MRRSRVNNPFKQQKNLFLHYLKLVSVAGSLTLLVIFQTLPSSSTKAETESLDDISEDHSDNEGGFQPISQEEFPSWIHEYYQHLDWTNSFCDEDNDDRPRLTRDILLASVRLGCNNIAENQNIAGNFNYQYDFVEKTFDTADSDVRQAGALWGMSLCYRYDPSNAQYRAAVEKGIRFFINHSVTTANEERILVQYPNEHVKQSTTGTNALFGLAIIEYLRTVESTETSSHDLKFVSRVRIVLRQLIAHLLHMQRPNKHFSAGFFIDTEAKTNSSSAYFDGETMLCLTKAARYIDGFQGLITVIDAAAFVLSKRYSIDAWVEDSDHDSDKTKGFYQWGSMFLTEYYHSQWEQFQVAGDFVVSLGHWILEVHQVLGRNRNTGYAFEGIVSAYQIARKRNLVEISRNFKCAIDKGLYKLTTWQVGSPLANVNPFLQRHPTDEAFAIGGVMNARNVPTLRIDTTQHQMHALIMALETVYT